MDSIGLGSNELIWIENQLVIPGNRLQVHRRPAQADVFDCYLFMSHFAINIGCWEPVRGDRAYFQDSTTNRAEESDRRQAMNHGRHEPLTETRDVFQSASLRAWFSSWFPQGATEIQMRAWPVIASGQNTLVVAPTGSGKTLAGFLSVIDRLLTEAESGSQRAGVSCVYVSPLKSLGYDIEKSLNRPLHDIQAGGSATGHRVTVGVRTGDSTAYARQKLRKNPPDILVTTPESLSILLTQPSWTKAFAGLKTVIVDEVHSLAGNKRGVDLAVSLERLADLADADPQRIGLSATCRPSESIARFLVGVNRPVTICESVADIAGDARTSLTVESLIRPDEAAYKPLVNHRLVCRLRACLDEFQTTIAFTNTRPMTERITFLIREHLQADNQNDSIVAAHHGSLDLSVRRQVESSLKSGQLRMVVATASLELGVDYDAADFVVQLGLPGSVTSCLQRLGRSGHGPGRDRQGVILAGHPSELAGAVVTARAALAGEIEEVRVIENPLDVLCQQLLGMACQEDSGVDAAYELVRRSWPYRNLKRSDFNACLNYLSGELPSPAGAFEAVQGAAPRWTAPRLWKSDGLFGVRHGRIMRWFRMNAGTIFSEETTEVECDGRRVGRLEQAYAERLQPGDRFILDGHALEFIGTELRVILARRVDGDGFFPIWTTDRPGLSGLLARRLSLFREELGRRLIADSHATTRWLVEQYAMRPADAEILVSLWQRQLFSSEVPRENDVLVEIYPEISGAAYAVHLPIQRSAVEAVGRALCARLGRRLGRDVNLSVSDLGCLIHTQDAPIAGDELAGMFHVEELETDVIEGVDRGELIARRFRHTAATGFMVLKQTEHGKVRVGGFDWVSRRLYPVVLETCPDHPLIREARREVLEELLDLPGATAFLEKRPRVRVRSLPRMSPFAAAWLSPFGTAAMEPIQYETPEDALRRLHERLFAGVAGNPR